MKNLRSSFSRSLIHTLSQFLYDFILTFSYTKQCSNAVKTQRPTVHWLRGEKFYSINLALR